VSPYRLKIDVSWVGSNSVGDKLFISWLYSKDKCLSSDCGKKYEKNYE